MLPSIRKIPNIRKYCLRYIFEDMKLKHEPNTLWLEFGTYSGFTINYISKHTNKLVYGFDSFEGLPEKWRDGFDKKTFNRYGKEPKVKRNVILVKGWFENTLTHFLKHKKDKKVSFLHLDADLYSSTKYVLDVLTASKRFQKGSILLFDELFNFKTFLGPNSELRALREWLQENPNIKVEWMGMNGKVYFDNQDHPYERQQAFLKIIDI